MLFMQLAAGRKRMVLTMEKYELTVSVSTKKIDGHITLHVKDNGNGIPQDVADKIFHPFFYNQANRRRNRIGVVTGV